VPRSSAAPARRSGRPTSAEAAQLDRDIFEAALDLFLDRGYEGTSMDDIATAARTTKQSVYARFRSKDDLFRATLSWASQREDWPVPEPPLPDTTDLETALRAIADAALHRAVNPQMVALIRLATAQAGRFPDMALQTFRAGWPRLQTVADLLRAHAATGAIRADDPEVLAEHFLGMVAVVPSQLAAVGIVRTRKEQRARADAAIQLFLRALQPG
jgi:AcrR family transcriptional regulator